jgi:hypothetical protein
MPEGYKRSIHAWAAQLAATPPPEVRPNP